MCKETTQLFDFLTLMENYKIEIPKIQRDYAQGRLSSSAKAAREDFASKLVRALVGEKPLLLDFVYGTVTPDVDGKNILYPLDGQQRLTTLFLLACLCQCAKSEWIFSYESRRAAKFFMEALKDENNISEILSFAQSQQTFIISGIIEKRSWFFTSWKEDVNIAGMLRMLDALYREISALQNRGKQFDFSRISFYVKAIPGNITDFDQIYLKMNARGKALSGWDNLKACLDSIVPGGMDKEYWSDCFNLKWPDLLWNPVDPKVEKVDSSMEVVVSYAFAATFKPGQYVDTNWEEFDGQQTKLIKSPAQEVELKHIVDSEKINQGRFDAYCKEWIYIPKDEDDERENEQTINDARARLCEERQTFINDFFGILDTFFSCLTENVFFIQQMSPWKLDIQKTDPCALAYGSKEEKEENRRRLLVYYALHNSKAIEQEKKEDWRRIVWNLIYNTQISNIEVFRSVFIALKELCNASEDILASIHTIQSNTGNDDLKSYNVQLQEEQDKAERINALDDVPIPRGFTSWKEAIVSAEKHAFFRGRISFLFHDGNGKVDWSLFKTKYQNARKFFDEAGVKQEFRDDGLCLSYCTYTLTTMGRWAGLGLTQKYGVTRFFLPLNFRMQYMSFFCPIKTLVGLLLLSRN